MTKEELVAAVWPDTIVEESNLSHNISVLRKTLRDDGRPYIETVPKRGYRFVAPVAAIDHSAESSTTGNRFSGSTTEETPARPRQDIRFCMSPDGVQIAYSITGSGPPLVKAANWLNHLEFDFESPVWRALHPRALGRAQLVRYDERGNGLSDWNVEDLRFEAMVDDLESRGRRARSASASLSSRSPG